MIRAIEWPIHGKAASVPPFFFASDHRNGVRGITPKCVGKKGSEPMTEEISYFEVTSYLVEIEAEYADVAAFAEIAAGQ